MVGSHTGYRSLRQLASWAIYVPLWSQMAALPQQAYAQSSPLTASASRPAVSASATDRLSDLANAQSSALEECIAFVSTCPPVVSSCAQTVCAGCTGLGATAVNSCCAQTDPVDCFSSYAAADDVASTNIITSPPAAAATSLGDPNVVACNGVVTFISVCEEETRGFDNLDKTDQASCLCYISSTWEPDVFDGFVASCASVAVSLDDSSALSVLGSAEGLCSSAGDVQRYGGGNGDVATPTVTRTTASPGATGILVASPTRATTTPSGNLNNQGGGGGTSSTPANNNGANPASTQSSQSGNTNTGGANSIAALAGGHTMFLVLGSALAGIGFVAVLL